MRFVGECTLVCDHPSSDIWQNWKHKIEDHREKCKNIYREKLFQVWHFHRDIPNQVAIHLLPTSHAGKCFKVLLDSHAWSFEEQLRREWACIYLNPFARKTSFHSLQSSCEPLCFLYLSVTCVNKRLYTRVSDKRHNYQKISPFQDCFSNNY